ncbi:ATP-binding protein [Paenibacillus caui]|uniref:ATP-binding protein n=1 Tax=Paenibacillus caui TaxID=2873927 RepID=UPI001CA8F427|nr:ATP-binding protein [Paenibacillus caui]
MSIHRIKVLGIPFISTLIGISSLILVQQKHLALLILWNVCFILSVVLERKFSWLRGLQFVFLGAFHYTSHLNWCVLLYYILLINLIQHKAKFREIMPLGFLIVLEYTVIRLTYMPATMYNLLVSVFDFITSIVVILGFLIIIQIESEKKKLCSENDFLITHDPLTGLLNYEGYMQAVYSLVEKKQEFQLVLLDINNFKSLNAKDVSSANDILIHLSDVIQSIFPDAYGLSRYAGDRFAILAPLEQNINDHVLNFDKLGLQITFSITRYPAEADTLQGIVIMAEDRILHMRRELWVKSQQDLMRSEKMKVIGELAAGMAHEIRNPLASIKGFIQLSKSKQFNIEPWYEVIMNEITRVGELTAEFLQFSKPQANNMKIESLTDCAARVFSLCESEAASRGHSFIFENANQAILIHMDRDKMIQVLINIIRNAFQAMAHPGEVYFRIKAEEQAAVIEVRDTGVGIEQHNLSKIFDPFFTTKEDGTGLGLSLCQKIIEDHQGAIGVESEIGAGTTFTIRLPLAKG